MTQVWCNGRFLDETEARLSISDRGFTLADGIFETLLGFGSKPVWLAEHLRRMRAGASILGLDLAFDDNEVEGAVIELLQRNGFTKSAVRMTLTRGPTSKRGLWVSDNPGDPTFLMTCAPTSEPVAQRVIVARSTRRNEHSPLSCIKSLNYGDNIFARREALGREATDALMLNGKEHVACATVGNLFIRIDGAWVTPPISDGILPGIAREKILPLLNAREDSISEADLDKADAAFISNSLGSADIIEIESKALQPCVSNLQLLQLYN